MMTRRFRRAFQPYIMPCSSTDVKDGSLKAAATRSRAARWVYLLNLPMQVRFSNAAKRTAAIDL